MQLGDIVILKSGGPKMTINFIEKGKIACCLWFDGPDLYRDYIPLIALKLI